ncbi:lamin tail domain-containing protein [Spirosoma sp. BT702]|uniref:Lamin tail domain-containing protein n=1 Tax=Spirosoma profusum TaxID=2771354 RepID=A0A927ANL0_9BACT|nr:putative Ig domain-containing protein [Spirosoma profusum]MBD2702074.1 lamin tail domain-containing protein [Spirosoma profusum]
MKHVSLRRVFLTCFPLLALWLMGSASWAQTTITQWNFNSVPSDVSNSTGTTTPSTGTGSLSTVGGTTGSFANGSGSSDPAASDNTGYGVANFPSATQNNKTAGIEFRVATTGFQSLTVSWDQRFSNTAVNRARLQYSTDGGTSYTDVTPPFSATAGDQFYNNNQYDLSSITAIDNRTDVRFRIVAEFSVPAVSPTSYTAANPGSTYATSGNWRFDMVTVKGVNIPAQPDLTVSVAGPSSAIVDQPFIYSLVVGNIGNATATNVPVSFTLPAGVSYVSATEADNFTATQSGGVVSFEGGAISASSSARLTVTVSSPTEGTITVQPGAAVVDEANTITESNKVNNGSTATVSTTVGSANLPPVAPAISDQNGVVAVPFSYTVPTFTDPESQTLAYIITGVAAGLSADNVTRIISGIPTVSGPNTVTVVATDPAGASVTATLGILINANQPSVAASLSNQTATVGVSFSYVVPAFTDPESQTLLYAATGLPNGLSFNVVTRAISGTPTTGGLSSVTITAIDPASNMTTAMFSFSVSSTPVGIIRITEYMYSGTPGEYFELTNVGNASVNLTGWSYDDNSRQAGSFSLSGLGIVQPGESVVVTEADVSVFRRAWYLPTSVKVLGGNTENLGRSDEINIYNTSATLVDRLTFDDQTISGSVRTNDVSGWTAPANLGLNQTATYQLAVVGDGQNSYIATTGNLGNPGGYYVPLNRVLVVESGSSTTVVEGGATDSYMVKLNSQPVANVIVSINPGSQLSVSPTSLTFTPSSYSIAQTVSVTAIDDNVVEGMHTAHIIQTTTSTDPAYNGIATNSVSVTITDKNTPPTVAQGIGSQTATLNVSYIFTIPSATFTDAQTPNNLTLSVAGLPAGLSFTSPNIISGTPSTTVGSPFLITVIATDPGNLSVNTTFLLTVSPPPQTPPTVAQLIASQTATVETAYLFTIPSGTFTDAETPNNLTLTVSGLPNGLSFSAPTTISGTPSTTVGSPFTVTIVATDPIGLSVSTTFTLSVLPVSNTNPAVVQSIGPQVAPVNQPFLLLISASNFTDAETPNGLALEVSGLPIGLTFTAPSTISGTPSSTVGSPFTVTVVVTDPGGLTLSTTFQITVTNSTACVNMFTIKAGAWDDPTVWSCGRLPVSTDVMTLNHAVTLPASYTGNALRVTFSPSGQLIYASGSKLRLN